jgi:hypothetical protein
VPGIIMQNVALTAPGVPETAQRALFLPLLAGRRWQATS